MTKRADLLCDLQYGSTGKGLFAGYLAHIGGYTAAVSANMPNAGHTFVDGKDKYVFKCLPIGSVSPTVKEIYIGPGAVFDLNQLIMEWRQVDDGKKKLFIHEGAVVLDDRHRETEQSNLNHIASTMQGSMAAMMDKMWRAPERDPRIPKSTAHNIGARVYVVSQREYHKNLSWHGRILVEGSQGYSLGINAGFWPFCTSRDCTPGRMFADCGIPIQWLRDTYGTLRTFPIRVGNTEGGNSGPVYTDQEELSWEELGQEKEMTTVTGRVRRVFTFSWQQYYDAWDECQPDYIFLNFVNYMEDPGVFVERVKTMHVSRGGKEPFYIGTGPDLNDVGLWV